MEGHLDRGAFRNVANAPENVISIRSTNTYAKMYINLGSLLGHIYIYIYICHPVCESNKIPECNLF